MWVEASLLLTWTTITLVAVTAVAGDCLTAGAMRRIGDLDAIRRESGLAGAIRAVLSSPLFLLGVLSDYDASVMSRRALEEKGEKGIATDPIGTGPYSLETVHQDPGQGVTLLANPDHFDGPPATERLQCLYIADTTARTLALLSGDVHMMEGVRSPGWADSIRAQKPDLVFDVVSPGSFLTSTPHCSTNESGVTG